MKTNRITRTKRQLIIALRDQDFTHAEIARQIGCHRNTVGKILRMEGMK